MGYFKSAVILAIFPLILTLDICDAVTSSSTDFIGQWIWSRSDAKIYQDSRRTVSNLVPCIWVSTITVSGGRIIQHLANIPTLAGSNEPIAIVIRFDDSFHKIWNSYNSTEIAQALDAKLRVIQDLVAESGIIVREVQLDYDCPVRRLENWATVVQSVGAGSLTGQELWITSLPSHLQDPRFTTWFSGRIKGHIIQLFDTSLAYNRSAVLKLANRLHNQRIPFRVGLGAFERSSASRNSNHRSWFTALPFFSSMTEYRGLWVFPGGNRWTSLISKNAY